MIIQSADNLIPQIMSGGARAVFVTKSWPAQVNGTWVLDTEAGFDAAVGLASHHAIVDSTNNYPPTGEFLTAV